MPHQKNNMKDGPSAQADTDAFEASSIKCWSFYLFMIIWQYDFIK